MDLEALSSAEALKALQSRPEGLSADEAEERLARFGPNALEEQRRGVYLISLALGLAGMLFLVGLHRHWPLLELAQFALILTMVTIPVVLSVTMAVGALALSRRRAIVSRLESIEEMAGMDILCADKTGTPTENRLTLGEPVLVRAGPEEGRILAGALASNVPEGLLDDPAPPQSL